jgi:uncharacterized caspase-like protein
MRAPLSPRPVSVLALAAALALPLAARADQPPGDRYALLVGVHKYTEAKELRPLPFAENDMTEMAAVLQEKGFRAENVVTLSQAQAKTKDDPRFAPMKVRILKELHLLLEHRSPADTVIVALAGHGVHFPGDPASYFCPADADLTKRETLLSLKEVYDELANCKVGVRLLLVDACRNDPFADKTRSAQVASVTRPAVPRPPEGIVAFFSCSEGERAYEDDDSRHGFFFRFVIEGLRGAAALGGDTVTVQDLTAYVTKCVEEGVRSKHGAIQKPEVVGRSQGATLLAAGLGNRELAVGFEHVRKQEFDKAVEVLTRGIQANPDNPELFQVRGVAHLNRRELDRAIGDFTAAINLPRGRGPGAAEMSRPFAFWLRGSAYAMKKDLARGILDCDQAIRLEPSEPRFYVTRAGLHLNSKQFDPAIADCTEGLRLDPANPSFYQVRGAAYWEKGDRTRAAADLAKYRELRAKK